MTNITFKVAPKGEGKTKWLLNVAYKYSRQHKIYLIPNTSQEFVKFCDKYFATYQEVCPVYRYDGCENVENAVVLIDNLFEHNLTTNTIEFIRRNCYKMFIAVDGTLEDNNSVDPYVFAEYEQLSIFDVLGEENNEG